MREPRVTCDGAVTPPRPGCGPWWPSASHLRFPSLAQFGVSSQLPPRPQHQLPGVVKVGQSRQAAHRLRAKARPRASAALACDNRHQLRVSEASAVPSAILSPQPSGRAPLPPAAPAPPPPASLPATAPPPPALAAPAPSAAGRPTADGRQRHCTLWPADRALLHQSSAQTITSLRLPESLWPLPALADRMASRCTRVKHAGVWMADRADPIHATPDRRGHRKQYHSI